MNDKTNAYFNALQEAATNGQAKAWQAWTETTRSQSSAFEVRDLPWDRDIHDFVETLRAAGVAEFAVTDRSTALMGSLHRLVDEGCTMQGLCKVTRDEIRWGEKDNTEYEAILFRT